MEEKEGIISLAATNEAPESFRIVPSGVNGAQVSGSVVAAASDAGPVSVSTEKVKKKRGRPRKYAPDGSLAVALSPMPISVSIPLTGDYSGWKQSRGRPVDSFKKKHHKSEFGSPREQGAYSGGANFSPHVLTVNAGEDVAMKIISFSQQGSRALCVLAANGAISNVTLRQPNSSGGTLTYEGRFEILSLTGSFIPSDNGITKSRSGGMSVSLAGSDGHVFGGGLAGILLASGAVQVVVGSFQTGNQLEQKTKKHRFEYAATPTAVPHPLYNERADGASSVPKSILSSSFSYNGDNLIPASAIHAKISAPESIYSAAAAEPKDP